MPQLKNPYGRDAQHKVCGCVSNSDFSYFRQLFGMITSRGYTDALIASLFQILIEELKANGLDPSNINHVAWDTEHQSFNVLASLLQRLRDTLRLQRSTLGLPNRDWNPGAQDVSGTANGLHPNLQRETDSQTETTSPTFSGSGDPGSQEETGQKQPGPSKGALKPVVQSDPLKVLRDLGIIT